MSAWVRSTLISLCVAIASFAAHAQNYSDIWFNPAESGWGLTIADHQSNLFAVWFTYRQDGKPTWYVIPGGTFTNGHQHFAGDIYATTGPAYSAATFDPSRVTATKVGTAAIDFASYGSANFTYTLAGVTQTKAISRQPFGSGSPRWGTDVTDIWYNPAESGWGLTLAQHGNNVFGVWFTYDTDGQPLWAVMPGVTFSSDTAFTGKLYTTTGPYFASQPFNSSQVVVKEEGSATVSWVKSAASSQCGGTKAATFQPSFRGTSRQSPACQQLFGSVAAPADFPHNDSLPDGGALFTRAPNPLDATITTDDSHAASQVITANGGTIVATDAKGNRYTLDIPPGAVTSDTGITMTPIASVAGPNYASGVSYGVKLEPDGLELNANAVFTLDPSTSFPLGYQAGFAAAGDGKDLHRAPPGPDFTRIQLQVSHFSFWGWLFMSAQERAGDARMMQARDAEANLMAVEANYLGPLRQKMLSGTYDSADPPPSPEQINNWFQAYYDQVLTPRLQAAQGSCFNAWQAYATVEKYNNLYKGIMFEVSPNFLTNMDTIGAAFGKLKDKTPCYFAEVATFQTVGGVGFVTAAIFAQWRTHTQDGNVMTYVPWKGTVKLDYPIAPPCAVTSAKQNLSKADGIMAVDWDARMWKGAALHNTDLTITCPPPNAESRTTQFPVLYLGDLNNQPTGFVSGRLNASNGIDKGSSAFGPMVTTWQFYSDCPAADTFFCGGPFIVPPPSVRPR